MVINEKIPVYKSVWMNKTKFFIIQIVPAIYFLLLTNFRKNIYKIIPTIFGQWNTEILLVLRVKTKQQLLIIFPESLSFSLISLIPE